MHHLQQRVDSVRRRAGRVRLLHAMGWLAVSLMAAGLLLGLLDFLLRSEELGVRLLFSLAVLAAAGWSFWRFLVPAINDRSTTLHVAQRIELRWPRLQDRLSSSLEFLSQQSEDPTAGSPALRRTVIAEAAAEIDALPLEQIVDHRRPRPVLITTGVLLAIVVLLSIAAPQVASQAARRLAMPWTADAWPRRNQLAFVDPPLRIPYGEPFRAELIDQNGTPPELVEIFYWFDGQQPEEVKPQTMKPTGEKMVHQLARVTRSFQYRASGGDDDTMGWYRVEVVEPPRIKTLTIDLLPPAYTGRTSRESSRHIQAIRGTTVTLDGKSTKPVVSAHVTVENDEGEIEIPLAISQDGMSFELGVSVNGQAEDAWTLTARGSYRIILIGEDGVPSGNNDRYQLDVVPDEPPRISVEAPEANTFATANATVPVVAVVEDDLAIARIELSWLRSDRTEDSEQSILLYDAETTQAERGAPAGETRTAKHILDLSTLEELAPGTNLAISVVASDFRPQTERSPPRRIVIITPDQLEDRIVQRQAFLLSQLAEALAIQRECRLQTGAIQIQLEKTGALASKDVVDVQSAELNQRRVLRVLADEPDGVITQINALIEVAQRNRLDNPELLSRLRELVQAIQRLTANQLPSIERELLTGLKVAQSAMDELNEEPATGEFVKQVKATVDSAATTQEDVIARLEQLLGGLSQWDSYRRFSRQMSSLQRDQQELAEQTAKLQTQTLSKSLQQLSPQEQADLSKQSLRQNELARRLERMLTKMQQMQGDLKEDPVAAQTLGDAIDLAHREGLSGQMRKTSSQIEQNQLGQATQSQQQVGEQLSELLDMLTGRREHQLERRLEQMREAAAQLQGLRDEQASLSAGLKAAESNPDQTERKRQLQRLESQRQQQQQEIERLARKLQRLRADDAVKSLSQAARHSQQGGEAAEEGESQQAQRQSDLAEQDLADAQQRLDEQIKKAEQDLLQEQLARLEQALEGMVDQQQTINVETFRLDNIRQQNGSLTRGQRASLRSTAGQQRGLIAEAGDFAEKIAAAEVFHMGLTGAMREMTNVANRLDTGEVGVLTQQAEERALTRLTQLVDALSEDDSAPAEEDGNSASGGGNQGQPPDGIRNIAQLKLLKLMQQALYARTAALEDIRQQRDWTESERVEVADLAQEQGSLAELVAKLNEAATEPPLEDSEALPDLEQELDQELQDVLDEFKVE